MKRIFLTILIQIVQNTQNQTTIASWNLLHLGWNNQKDLEAVQTIANNFDFLAIQELMNPKGIKDLKETLEQRTNNSYKYIYSDQIGSTRYKEMYGFIWNESKIKYQKNQTLYIRGKDIFERPPFSQQFKIKETNEIFVIGTIHIVFGKSIKDRTPEILELKNYYEFLKETNPEQDFIIIQGDFNLPQNNKQFNILKEVMNVTIHEKTSLSTKPGIYQSQYDNIFIDTHVKDSGIIKFPEVLKLDWKHQRKHVSDHLPVYIIK